MSKDKSKVVRKNLLKNTNKGQFATLESKEEDREKSGRIKRRGVIRGAIASAAALVGFGTATSTAAASEEISEVERQRAVRGYESPETVNEELQGESDLLTELADEGFIKNPSADTFAVSSLSPPDPGTENISGELLQARRVDGEITPEIRIVRELDEGLLSLYLFPEAEGSYAVLKPSGDDEVRTFGKGILQECSDRDDPCNHSAGECFDGCEVTCCASLAGYCLRYCCQCKCYCCSCGWKCPFYCV